MNDEQAMYALSGEGAAADAEAQAEQDRRDSLGLFTHWLLERRKDDEARLKRLGLTWTQLKQVEAEALSQFGKEDTLTIGKDTFYIKTYIDRVIPAEEANKFTKIIKRKISLGGR